MASFERAPPLSSNASLMALGHRHHNQPPVHAGLSPRTVKAKQQAHAAEQGDADAQYALGFTYDTGRGRAGGRH